MNRGAFFALFLTGLAALPAGAQSLANSFATLALQRCVPAAERGAPPQVRALFPGEPVAGALPEGSFAPVATWLTSDGRIYVAVDAAGNCAVGDTQAAGNPAAHQNGIRRFETWAKAQVDGGRYLDSGLPDDRFAYSRTFVYREATSAPLLVSLISDPEAGILAVIAERALPVGGSAEPLDGEPAPFDPNDTGASDAGQKDDG